MKIRERVFDDDGRLVIQQTHDASRTMHKARMLRDSGRTLMSDSVCLGTVPGALVAVWAKEAGIAWNDTEALEDLVTRKLMDGEFAKFRVYEGKI